jgi:hypothetical protein
MTLLGELSNHLLRPVSKKYSFETPNKVEQASGGFLENILRSKWRFFLEKQVALKWRFFWTSMWQFSGKAGGGLLAVSWRSKLWSLAVFLEKQVAGFQEKRHLLHVCMTLLGELSDHLSRPVSEKFCDRQQS